MMWRVAPTPRFNGTRILLIDIEIYLPANPVSIRAGMKAATLSPQQQVMSGGEPAAMEENR
jgi:hypothetical protein